MNSKKNCWYDVETSGELHQGELFENCPVYTPKEGVIEGTDQAVAQFEVHAYDVVVLSPTADLLHRRVRTVVACPHWSLDEFAETNVLFESKKGKEMLRRGNVRACYMLAPSTLEGFEHGIRVVDFRSVLSLPIELLHRLVESGAPRLRLRSPYLEHMVHAFAGNFMRVCLPVEIPPFS